MKYNLSLFDNIGRLLTSILTYIIIFVTVLMIFQKGIPAPHFLFGIPIILVCYHLVQYYCYQTFLYILLHAGFLLPACLIPFPVREYRYLYLILICFETVQAVLIRRQGAEKPYRNIPWHLLTGTCLVYIIAIRYHQTEFAQLIYYLGLGLIILHFIRFFLSGLTRLLSGSTKSTSIPATKIILNHTYLILLFLLVFIVLAVSIQYSGVEDAFRTFGTMLAKVIGVIFRFLFYIVTIVKALFSNESRVEETQRAEEDFQQAFDELGEPTLLARMIEGIFTIACILIIACCIYRIIQWFIRLCAKRYTQDTDLILQLTKPAEVTKTTKNKTSVAEQIREFFKTDNASKIRHGYRLKIRSYKSLVHKECDTPIELAERIELTCQDNIDELTTVYEKARYSNEEITFDDVQKGGIL